MRWPSVLGRLPAWLVAVALVVGLVLGGAIGALALADPTGSDEYQALQGQLEDAEDRADEQSRRADVAEDRLDQRSAELDQRGTELDGQEQAVAAREAAVTIVEQQVAARSIGIGFWTVGVDVEPGTYRTAEAVTSRCYWAIYRSGTNGGDIVENDNVEGGFPTVTLSVGQDFENSGCPDFVKQ